MAAVNIFSRLQAALFEIEISGFAWPAEHAVLFTGDRKAGLGGFRYCAKQPQADI
jgi:hypothetical protein